MGKADFMPHHYDTHDHDKLLRWRDALYAAPPAADGFPAMVLFLVRPTDAAAHEIFRRYRTEFEQRGASFAQLVIFGMHGVSAAVRALLRPAGLSESDLPLMLLAPSPAGDGSTTDTVAITLPAGDSLAGSDDLNGDGTCDYLAPWQDALDRIRITRYGSPLRLTGIQGRQLGEVDLSGLATDALSAAAGQAV